MSPEPHTGPLTAADLQQLADHGIAEAEARRQLALLQDPPEPIALVAPCTPQDGVEIIEDAAQARLTRLWSQAADAGRILKLVPASGAASRMFATLSLAHDELNRGAAITDAAAAADLATLVQRLDDLPFAAQLRAHLDGPPDPAALLHALLDPEALDYARLPKGLVPFHLDGAASRTPVQEHLAEAAELVRDATGRSRVHFTIAAGAQDAFRAEAHLIGTEADYELGFSVQEPSTDTLAIDEVGAPFRTDDGKLLLRPGGHGSLIGNLARLAADIVLLKNIDNVQPRSRRQESLAWQRILTGRLLELEDEAQELARRLDVGTPGARGAATTFLARTFYSRHTPTVGARTRGDLIAELECPLRVCGVVVNTGEPGGGPFWVTGRDGSPRRQIVEAAEVAAEPAQQAILADATHFNPVLMALSLRNTRNEPYHLARYVDADRAFISRKSAGGTELQAIEHPGLWNGAMAGWNTVFIQVPAAAFTPVKAVFDLLRPEHQPC